MRSSINATLAIAALLIGTFVTLVESPIKANATTVANNYVAVDISSTANPNDQPFAINCNVDPNYVYMTIYQMGKLARIDKVSKTVTLIEHPEGSKAAGRGFYSMTNDSSGNLWINERLTGRIWKFNPSGNTWASIPTIEQVVNSKVTYPSGYSTNPGLIRVDENPGSEGIVTYVFGGDNYGDLLYAGGSIWMGLSYNLAFDAQAQAVGVNPVTFTGLIKIDPSTNAITRIPIASSVNPTGLSADKSDSTIIWVTDQAANKVYKFSTTSNTVTQTITLPANSNPKGLDNDASNVYVALSQDKAISSTSKIMKIAKSDLTQTVIDTGAPNTSQGTFTVYLVGTSQLIFTDLSGHVGSVDTGTLAKTYQNTAYANDNHFGCLVGGTNFWFAGHGSVKAGIISLDDLKAQYPDQPKTVLQQAITMLDTAHTLAINGVPTDDKLTPSQLKYSMYDLVSWNMGAANAAILAYDLESLGHWDQLTEKQRTYVLEELLGYLN